MATQNRYEKYRFSENKNNFETKNIQNQNWKKAGECEPSVKCGQMIE